jgi:Holliday junction resolvase RusA-like endonuclease
MRTQTFILSGRIPTKKNGTCRVKRGRRTYTMASEEYRAWEPIAVMELRRQHAAAHSGMVSPMFGRCAVRIGICFPDQRKADLGNKAEGVLDALVKAKIIVDDNWKIVRSLFLYAVENGEPGAFITVEGE